MRFSADLLHWIIEVVADLFREMAGLRFFVSKFARFSQMEYELLTKRK